MIKKTFILIGAAAIFMAGCGGKPANAEESTSTQEKKEANSPIGSPEDDASQATDIDLARYVASSSQFGTFGQFLSRSTWSAKTKDKRVTFLCPSDESLKRYNQRTLSELKRPENIAVMDKMIASHLLQEEMSFETIFRQKELVTVDGTKLFVDSASRTINGISCTTREVITKGGTVIIIEGIINHDDDQVKEAVMKKPS